MLEARHGQRKRRGWSGDRKRKSTLSISGSARGKTRCSGFLKKDKIYIDCYYCKTKARYQTGCHKKIADENKVKNTVRAITETGTHTQNTDGIVHELDHGYDEFDEDGLACMTHTAVTNEKEDKEYTNACEAACCSGSTTFWVVDSGSDARTRGPPCTLR